MYNDELRELCLGNKWKIFKEKGRYVMVSLNVLNDLGGTLVVLSDILCGLN